MNKESILNTDHLISFSNEEMKAYIYKLQDDLQSKLNTGLSIDDILDIEDPFEAGLSDLKFTIDARLRMISVQPLWMQY